MSRQCRWCVREARVRTKRASSTRGAIGCSQAEHRAVVVRVRLDSAVVRVREDDLGERIDDRGAQVHAAAIKVVVIDLALGHA